MKIIDTHTHLAGNLFGIPGPIDTLRSDLEQQGVCRAWIFTIDGLIEDPKPHNDRLAQATAPSRDFFIPFCTVDPYEGATAAIAELTRARRDLGMAGLKLHPWLQAFPMVHSAVVPLLRTAGDLGMPVLVHDGTPPYSTPLQIAAAAEQAPGATVILGHAGLDDLTHDAILACQRQRNIYLCCTSLSIGWIDEALSRCPPDRLLYGSDGGLGPGIVEEAVAKMRATEAHESLLRQVFFDNADRLLPQTNAPEKQTGEQGE